MGAESEFKEAGHVNLLSNGFSIEGGRKGKGWGSKEIFQSVSNYYI